MNKVNSIKEKKASDVARVGIVLAKDWWDATYKPAVQPFDYVVVKWSDYHDGVKSNIEGLETVAICRKLEHAELIYNIL
jgi:hypothetical protein